jgi:hypothetical protein
MAGLAENLPVTPASQNNRTWPMSAVQKENRYRWRFVGSVRSPFLGIHGLIFGVEWTAWTALIYRRLELAHGIRSFCEIVLHRNDAIMIVTA